jgi:hypothetical protein
MKGHAPCTSETIEGLADEVEQEAEEEYSPGRAE